MKRAFLALLLFGAVFATPPTSIALADGDGTSVGQAPPSDGSTNLAGGGTENDEQGKKHGRFKHALAQLNLTDAQMEQIKQIRSTVTDRKERRQQIMGVLTTDQKSKLKQMIQAHRNGGQASGGTATAPDGN